MMHMNRILLLNKPLGISSNAAMQRARRYFNRCKAGHGGSLDPLATGMLPIAFGHATRLCGRMLESDKEYRVLMVLGARTMTGDAEGDVVERKSVPEAVGAKIERVLPDFSGEITQRPPVYSAIKHQGQPLYKLARQGKPVQPPLRRVRIYAIRLVEADHCSATLVVRCSKGTYIRSLVEDIAVAIGSCAYVGALHRTYVAPFSQYPMVSFDELEAQASIGGLDALRLMCQPMDVALHGFPRIRLSQEQARCFRHGQRIQLDPFNLEGGDGTIPLCHVVDWEEATLGLGNVDEAQVLRVERLLCTAG